MLLKGCQMSPLRRLALVWLIYASSVVLDFVESNTCDGVCENPKEIKENCKNQRPVDYDPAKATCGEVNHTHAEVTQGISCCGEKAYNPLKEICCNSTLKIIPANLSKAKCCRKVVIDEDKNLCCGPDEVILNRTSSDHQCCGHDQYNIKTDCCCKVNGVLTKLPSNRKGQCNDETEDLYDVSAPDWPIQHYCGTEAYLPETHICCNGNSNEKKENHHCCGDKTYNISNTEEKCCAGTPYNLPAKAKHCCGSILLKEDDVCCLSEDKEMNYTKLKEFSCCGHLYYNTSVWSCCAGDLRRRSLGECQDTCQKSFTIVSLNNLTKTELCEQKKLLIGTVESVSLYSIVFSSVLQIHRTNATVKALPSPHILETPDRCNAPKMISGQTYFFNENHLFTDFNHDSILQSLHFIISKCYHR